MPTVTSKDVRLYNYIRDNQPCTHKMLRRRFGDNLNGSLFRLLKQEIVHSRKFGVGNLPDDILYEVEGTELSVTLETLSQEEVDLIRYIRCTRYCSGLHLKIRFGQEKGDEIYDNLVQKGYAYSQYNSDVWDSYLYYTGKPYLTPDGGEW